MIDFLEIYLPELFYLFCGLVCFDASLRSLKNEHKKYGTALFWLLVGIVFMLGKILPSIVVGIILVIMSILTATKQVTIGKFKEVSYEYKEKQSRKLGNKIFIPAISIGLIALLLSFVKYQKIVNGKTINVPLDGAVMTGTACVIALILAMIICKPKVKDVREDTTKLLMQVGTSCLLPQLLGALGTLFSEAGVGKIIASMISNIVPDGNILIGVIVYVLGMVLFTMIMGNAFAAFTVITIGVGIPFVINQGGNPAIIGALGMTAGYCGTLLTPMAANFNIVPCAVLETKDQKWAVIKQQAPMAFILIIVHIILMLTIGF